MGEKEKKGLPKWIEKLKNVKHIEIYIIVIFLAIILLIYFNTLQSKTTSKEDTTADTLSITGYINNLEDNLEDILSNISGVDEVKVMITLNLNQVAVEDSKINLSNFPEINGVLVTGKGLNNTATKLKVLHAVEAVLEVTKDNIEILSSD